MPIPGSSAAARRWCPGCAQEYTCDTHVSYADNCKEAEQKAQACWDGHKRDSAIQADERDLDELNFCIKCGDAIGPDTTSCSCDQPETDEDYSQFVAELKLDWELDPWDGEPD